MADEQVGQCWAAWTYLAFIDVAAVIGFDVFLRVQAGITPDMSVNTCTRQCENTVEGLNRPLIPRIAQMHMPMNNACSNIRVSALCSVFIFLIVAPLESAGMTWAHQRWQHQPVVKSQLRLLLATQPETQTDGTDAENGKRAAHGDEAGGRR